MKLLIVTQKFNGDPYSSSPELPYRLPNVQFEYFDWTVVTTHELPRLSVNNLLSKFGKLPKVVLVWMNLKYIQQNIYFFKTISRNKKEYNILTCWYFDDIHNNTINRRKVIQYVDIVLNSYQYYLHNYYSEVINESYWFPHSVNEILVEKINFNKNPENKILLSGSISEHIYPARYKLSLLASNDTRIEQLSHPGYSQVKSKHNLCGYNYYKHMNNYFACFTCCAFENRPYIVAKFFEIISCGSLLLAYDAPVKNYLKQLGFIDGINYISCDNDTEDIKQKLDYIFDPENRKLIDEIRYAGYLLSSERHFLIDRVEDFCEYLEYLEDR